MSTYCLHLWIEIRVAYNNVFRKSSSASHMFASNDVLNFEALIRINVYSFRQRSASGDI